MDVFQHVKDIKFKMSWFFSCIFEEPFRWTDQLQVDSLPFHLKHVQICMWEESLRWNAVTTHSVLMARTTWVNQFTSTADRRRPDSRTSSIIQGRRRICRSRTHRSEASTKQKTTTWWVKMTESFYLQWCSQVLRWLMWGRRHFGFYWEQRRRKGGVGGGVLHFEASLQLWGFKMRKKEKRTKIVSKISPAVIRPKQMFLMSRSSSSIILTHKTEVTQLCISVGWHLTVGLKLSGWNGRDKTVGIKQSGWNSRVKTVGLKRSGCNSRDKTVGLKQSGWNSRVKTVGLKQSGWNGRVKTVGLKQSGWNGRVATVGLKRSGCNGRVETVGMKRSG